MPRNTAVAPNWRAKSTINPSNVATETLPKAAVDSRSISARSSTVNSGFLTGLLRIATVRCSKSFDPR